jgi:hypothetical protein
VTAPLACELVVHVIEVGLTTFTLLQADPPKSTVAPVINPVPVIVTGVRPVGAPAIGETLVMVGAVW